MAYFNNGDELRDPNGDLYRVNDYRVHSGLYELLQVGGQAVRLVQWNDLDSEWTAE